MKINIVVEAETEEVAAIVSGFGSRKTDLTGSTVAAIESLTNTLKVAGLDTAQISGVINRFLEQQ